MRNTRPDPRQHRWQTIAPSLGSSSDDGRVNLHTPAISATTARIAPTLKVIRRDAACSVRKLGGGVSDAFYPLLDPSTPTTSTRRQLDSTSTAAPNYCSNHSCSAWARPPRTRTLQAASLTFRETTSGKSVTRSAVRLRSRAGMVKFYSDNTFHGRFRMACPRTDVGTGSTATSASSRRLCWLGELGRPGAVASNIFAPWAPDQNWCTRVRHGLGQY